jgi:hypothetical protein
MSRIDYPLTAEPDDWEKKQVSIFLGKISIGGEEETTCGLSRNQVVEMIPVLQYWLEHGTLPVHEPKGELR